jgi:hypothetical protein
MLLAKILKIFQLAKIRPIWSPWSEVQESAAGDKQRLQILAEPSSADPVFATSIHPVPPLPTSN